MTIAIYSRKSKFTGKGESIANQIELCRQEAREYLRRKNIEETEVNILAYEDEGFSGKSTARPEFQKMISAVKARKIDCVICYKLDRISRNVGDFARTYEDFEKNKVDFLCVSEKYDTTTPAGRAMMGMVSVFAQLERETTAERIRDNMHMLARTGRWLGGHTPTGFGSQKEDRVDVAGKTRSVFRLIPVAKELELVKFIYEKFMETWSLSGTTRYLVRNNIRTKNGKDFSNTAVKDILRNPVYCIAGTEAGDYFESKSAVLCYDEKELDNQCGFMPYNRTSSGKTNQTRNKTPDWLIAVGKHDGIIPSGVWVQVQNTLDAKRERNRSAIRTPYKSEALLSGLLVCGTCGSAMRPHVHTSRRTADGRIPYYYICELKERSSGKRCGMNNANGLILDQAVMDGLLRYEHDAMMIHKSLRELALRISNHKESKCEQQGFLHSELESRQLQMQRLLDALSEGSSDDAFAEQVRQRVNELAEQCKKLELEATEASFSSEIYADCEHRNETIKNTLKKLNDVVLAAPTVEKRGLLKSTVGRVVWNGKEAHIFPLEEDERT